MVELIFSLRFQSQLRRTRPALMRRLERSVVSSIEEFGGKTGEDNKIISGSFNEESVGFIFDVYCILERLNNALGQASSELYGYICVFGAIAREQAPFLLQHLPVDRWSTGIWCDQALQKLLESLVIFEEPLSSSEYSGALSGYARVKALRESLADEPEKTHSGDNSEMINKYLKQGSLRNTVIVGGEYIGKREGLYRYCAASMKDFPPMVMRFGYANAVICAADCLSPEIKKVLAREDLEKLEEQSGVFFRERLRGELPAYLLKNAVRFFLFFLESYKAAADRAKVHPVLILENLQDADSFSRIIIAGAYESLSKGKFYLYGTCTDIQILKPWEELFPRIIKFSPLNISEETPPDTLPMDIPRGLWEMAYACALFSRYFPSYLIPRLFAEEGKNSASVEKTLKLLSGLRLINNARDPSPRRPELAALSGKALGERAEKIRAMVRERLLSWIDEGRLKPCYGLLAELFALGGKANETLMLEAVCGDVIGGSFRTIEAAVEDGSFEAVAGENSAPLLAIFKTQKALVHGNSDEIKASFMEEQAREKNEISLTAHPCFRAWMGANRTSFNLGICDFDAAESSVKKALLVTQQENSGRFLARMYRLFSLVNFSKRDLSDAIDYFAFAAEEAEKDGGREELALINFYSAAAHFIFGNLSKAGRLAFRAEEEAAASGQPDWADRSKFFRGRICFEAGRYGDALDIFSSLETDFYGSGFPEFRATLAAWIYRTNAYLHPAKSNPQAQVPPGFDAKLFEIESMYLSKDYRKTLELAGAAGEITSKDRFLYIEQPDWRSGFAQCELFLFPLRDLWERVFLTYRTLALCQLSGAEQLRDNAIREMRRIMRDELPDTDPNDAFYFYSYYQILKLSGAPEVDMNTAISLAFKRLQRRASRIDDNETRRAFLTKHYWNSALEKTAREHKLI